MRPGGHHRLNHEAPDRIEHRWAHELVPVPRSSATIPEPKTCVACGRTITWRKKWERDWDAVKYCSKSCRRAKPNETDERLESAILELLRVRGGGATICPSEAARSVDPQNWRDLMEPARAAARRLVASEKIEITQNGRAVDPSTARGPIRLRRRP